MRHISFPTAFALLLVLAGCGSETASPTATPDAVRLDGLWTASASPSTILHLNTEQLSGRGVREPTTELTTPSARLFTLLGVAFDPAGNLWIASEDDSLLLSFPAEALAGTGERTPGTVIAPVDRSLVGPVALAFDARDRLWVANRRNGTVVRYDASQLAAGGSVAPAVVLRVPGNPSGLAFDAAGSLWISDSRFQWIIKYPAAQLETSGAPAATFALTRQASSLVNPGGLVFDAEGTLWVANTGAGNLLAFSRARLAGNAPVPPDIEITSTGGSLSIPVGLAFDGGGNLWVMGGAGLLTQYAAGSLGGGGPLAPNAQLEIAGHTLFWSLAFWPRPAGLRLNR
jgi:ligand-binding sensor domain-containing protein